MPTELEQNPDPRIALVQQALSATLEARAMIDITERDYADSWPTLAGTETGRHLLEFSRPHLDALERDLHAAIEWVRAGKEDAGDAQTLAVEAEDQIRLHRLLLARAYEERRAAQAYPYE